MKFLSFALIISLLAGASAEEIVSAKNGRITIVRNEQGLVVRGKDGEMMRGSSLMAHKYGRSIGEQKHIFDDAYWKKLKAGGLNAVRLCYFDPWHASHGTKGTNEPWPHTDLDDPDDLAEHNRVFDHVVDKAEEFGMYVLINYHNTGGYQDPDYSVAAGNGDEFPYKESYDGVIKFWELTAPRYADRKHVFYEILNEYVRWRSDNFTTKNLDDTYDIYRTTRLLAPETHIVLGSFPNHRPGSDDGMSMHGVAQELENRGVDFRNASIGFHPYNYTGKVNYGDRVYELIADYPGINTEQNYPVKYAKELDWLDALGLDGDFLGAQSMERIGMSWFHWLSDTPKQIDELYYGRLLPDAKAKGYIWFDTKDIEPLAEATEEKHPFWLEKDGPDAPRRAGFQEPKAETSKVEEQKAEDKEPTAPEGE